MKTLSQNLLLIFLSIFVSLSISCGEKEMAALTGKEPSKEEIRRELNLPTTIETSVGEKLDFAGGDISATLLEVGTKQDYCAQYSSMIRDCSVELEKRAVLVRVQSAFGVDMNIPLVRGEAIDLSWGFSMNLISASGNTATINLY